MEDLTFAGAIDLHLRPRRAQGCSQRSLDTLREETVRHLGNWFSRFLASFSRHEVAGRHDALSDTSGPYLANP